MNGKCIAAGCFLALQRSKSVAVKTHLPLVSLVRALVGANALASNPFGLAVRPLTTGPFVQKVSPEL